MTTRKILAALKPLPLCLFIVPFIVNMVASPAIKLDPLVGEDAFIILLLGLALSGFVYLAGYANASSLLGSLDERLMPFTPLTPARLLWQNLKHALNLLIMLFPVLPILAAIGRYTSKGAFANPLFGLNAALTFLSLFLYPLLMASDPRLRPLDGFFFLRRLVLLAIAYYRRIAYRMTSLRRLRPFEGFIAIGICLAIGRAFAKPILALLLDWNRSGPGARFLSFLFAPFWGIFYIHSSEAAAWEAQALTIFLMGLTFASLYAYSRLFRLKPGDRERERHQAWLAIRDRMESFEADWYANAAAPARLEMNRRIEMAAHEERETAPDAASATLIVESFAAVPTESLPYDPLPAPIDQIDRHTRHWLGTAAKREISPSEWGFIFFISMSVVLASTVSVTANSIDFAAVALIAVGVPFVFSFGSASQLNRIRRYAYFASLDWKSIARRMFFASSRKRLAIEIAAAAWISLAIGARIWGWAPVWFMYESMRWCIAGATCLEASSSARSKGLSKLIGYLLIATIILGYLLIALIALINDDTGQFGSFGTAQAVLIADAMFLHVLAWEFILIYPIKRRYGTQIVMDPRHESRRS